jgi:hypothetical protein
VPEKRPSPRISEIERRILRALCQCADADTAREQPSHELEDYRWHEPEHRVVYEALKAVGGRSGKPLREQLAAEAVRMGFPDVDWAAYFEAADPATAGLPELLRELKAAVRER